MSQTLAEQSAAISANFAKTAPLPVQNTVKKGLEDHLATFDTTNILLPGTKLPPFTLPSATGEQVTSADLLKQHKGLLVAFYRGSWCPFCNLALRSLQQLLPTLHAKGVQLVAISPQLPDASLSTQEKLDLTFPVLSDVGNAYARELGLVWKMADEMKPLFEKMGGAHNLEKTNGDASFEVPVPATFLVGVDGVVKNSFVEKDYRMRVEPEEVLGWVNAL